MKNIFYGLLVTLTVTAIILSCKHEPIPTQADLDRQTPQVCFQTEVLPLFQSYCSRSGCHDDGTMQNGYDLTNYDSIVAHGVTPGIADNSEIYLALYKTGTTKMPQPTATDLSDDQRALIRRWLNQGAKNTTGCGPTTCDTSKYKFAADIQPILVNYCTGCHGGTAPQGHINLDGYNNVKNTLDNYYDSFVGDVTDPTNWNPMPKNADSLTDCNQQKLLNWINAGYPNN